MRVELQCAATIGGASYPVGYTSSQAFNNDEDYNKILNNVKNNKKGLNY